MRRKISFALVALVVAALAFSNPVVAEAARKITSGDIRNGAVRSKDVHNDTLLSRDVDNNTLRSKDVRDGSLLRKDFFPGAASVAAYARVLATPANVTLDSGRSKNVVGVTRTAQGVYCVELAGDVNRVVAVVAAPEGALGNASAQWTNDCGTNGVQIQTERLSLAPGGNNLASTVENNVSFHVIVP